MPSPGNAILTVKTSELQVIAIHSIASGQRGVVVLPLPFHFVLFYTNNQSIKTVYKESVIVTEMIASIVRFFIDRNRYRIRSLYGRTRSAKMLQPPPFYVGVCLFSKYKCLG